MAVNDKHVVHVVNTEVDVRQSLCHLQLNHSCSEISSE